MSFPFAGAELGPDIASFIYESLVKNKSKLPVAAMSADSKYKRLARRVTAISPEVKIITYSSVLADIGNNAAAGIDLFTPIIEGTGDNERIGDKIKVKSIEVRGIHSDNNDKVDLYLVNPHDLGTPAVGDFVGTVGGHYFKNKGTEIYHKGPTTGSSVNDVCAIRKYFSKYPLGVHYTSADVPDKNRYWLIIINRSGIVFTANLSVKIKYIDA